MEPAYLAASAGSAGGDARPAAPANEAGAESAATSKNTARNGLRIVAGEILAQSKYCPEAALGSMGKTRDREIGMLWRSSPLRQNRRDHSGASFAALKPVMARP